MNEKIIFTFERYLVKILVKTGKNYKSDIRNRCGCFRRKRSGFAGSDFSK
jgi:hypothetical protein